jgi:hypothetical protein
LKIKPEDLHRGFSEAFQELNKQTHIRPDTILGDADEIEEFSNNVIGALDGVFDVIDELKETIAAAINKELHGEAMSVFVRETIAELDEIAGHYNTGAVWIEEAKVISLDVDSIQVPHRRQRRRDVDARFQSRWCGVRRELPISVQDHCPRLRPDKLRHFSNRDEGRYEQLAR